MRWMTLLAIGVLGLVSPAITAYSMTAMFTSNGVGAPNVIVWIGLVGVCLMLLAAHRLWREQR